MAHIRIEDLPPIEDLTQEELEETFGAGRGFFRPRLEGLEGREMMDAGLGNALLLPVAPPSAGHVRMLTLEHQQITPPWGAPASQAASQAQGGLHRDYLFGDTQTLIERGQQFLRDTVIGGFDRWGLHRNVQFDSKQVDGDKVKLTFKVVYGVQGDSTCKIDLTFEGKDTGNVRAYTLSAAALRDWEGLPIVGKLLQEQFEGVAKELFNKELRSIDCDRFDEKAAGETASAIRRELLDRLHAFIGDKNEEAGTGGFRNVKVSRIDGGYQVDLSVTWPNFKEATMSFRFTGETVDPSTGRVRFDANVAHYTPATGQQNLGSFFQDGVCKDFSVQLSRSLEAPQSAALDGNMEALAESVASLRTADTPPRLGAMGANAVTQVSDTDVVREQAEKFLKDKVIGEPGFLGLPSNRWALHQKGMYIQNTIQNGNEIEVQFRVWAGGGGGQGCLIRLGFQGRLEGGDMVYRLALAELSNYNGVFGDMFDSKTKEWFKESVSGGIHVQKFDGQKFGEGVAWQLEQIASVYEPGLLQGTYVLKGVQAIDGGIRVEIWNPRHLTAGRVEDRGFILEFKYTLDDVKAGAFKLDSCRVGAWKEEWNSRYGGTGVFKFNDGGWVGQVNHLMAARWEIAPARYDVQAVGQRFGEQALQFLHSNASTHAGLERVSEGALRNISVVRSGQGLTVTVELERKVRSTADGGTDWVKASVTFELKYEGKVNGKDSFSCVEVTSKTSSSGGPHSLQCWGATNESLKQRFANFVAG